MGRVIMGDLLCISLTVNMIFILSFFFKKRSPIKISYYEPRGGNTFCFEVLCRDKNKHNGWSFANLNKGEHGHYFSDDVYIKNTKAIIIAVSEAASRANQNTQGNYQQPARDLLNYIDQIKIEAKESLGEIAGYQDKGLL